ncbi:MAG: hypothetical protein Kow0062_27600 [Acidobacteriota bacterium]
MSAGDRRRATPGLTQVGRGAVVTGSLEGPGPVIVHGTIHGRLRLTGELFVARGARVDGTGARVRRLRVEGWAEGDFRVEQDLELGPEGHLAGSATARALETAAGSSIDAKLTITKP